MPATASTSVDLPGTYSLAPRSPDEMVAVDVLLARRSDQRPVDLVVSIVDASNLERNLYLVSQVLELGLPTVVALNMADVAEARGLKLNIARLRQQLGVPVILMQANSGRGVADLKRALVGLVGSTRQPPRQPVSQGVSGRSRPAWAIGWPPTAPGRCRPIWSSGCCLDSSGYLSTALLNGQADEVLDRTGRRPLAPGGGGLPGAGGRSHVALCLGGQGAVGRDHAPTARVTTPSDRLDRMLTHRVWGTAFFALVMLLVFSSIFVFAQPVMDLVDGVFHRTGQVVGGQLQPGALRSLLVDGVIGGVGSVLIFLPQIMLLFLFIAILEDCGYMARAAYLMDRLMSRVGLSGKSFIPLLVVVRLRHSGRHGHAGDREPPRPADDDPGRAADELQRPAAGL